MGANEKGSLSFASSIERAVRASAQLQAAFARVRAAEAEAKLAGLAPNPIVNIVYRLPEGGGPAVVEAGIATDLFALLHRERRAEIAGARLEAEAATALSVALDVVAETQQRYIAVQALEALVRSLEQRRSVLQRLREIAQVRLEVGEGVRQDVTTLDSELASLSVEAASRRQDLRLARLTLARTIGEPSASAEWTLDPWEETQAVPATERSWIETALEKRPELLAIQWELEARRAEEKLARKRSLEGQTIGLSEESDGNASLGPSLTTPIRLFDHGEERGELARALSAEQRHRLAETKRSVIEDVRSAWTTLTSAQENLARVDRELLPLQTRRRTEIEELFARGFADSTALLFADQALQETQTKRVELARDLALARSRLERSVGGPLILRPATQETP